MGTAINREKKVSDCEISFQKHCHGSDVMINRIIIHLRRFCYDPYGIFSLNNLELILRPFNLRL